MTTTPLHPSDTTSSIATKRYVFHFGAGFADHGIEARDLLGNKGANLCELARFGAPVPPGFVIATDACRYRIRNGHLPPELAAQIREGISWIEAQTQLRFGSADAPLLVSVRSGARDSMPGMMDTVLNIGASPEVLDGLATRTGHGHRFALDCRRRLIQMFGSVVLGIDAARFEAVLAAARTHAGAASDAELPLHDIERLVVDFESIVSDDLPADPWMQLERAVSAVFDSWMGERACIYRAHHGIPDDWGTAVTVQAMVYGNTGPTSASGVVFTRDPASGEALTFGEYLPDAQGEDVVSGSRTPQPIPPVGAERDTPFGEPFAELHRWLARLDHHYRDMQDVEFTIENGLLWLLQTRAGKRSPQAAVRIAVELAQEGIISEADALLRVSTSTIAQLQTDRLARQPDAPPMLTGLPASPGIAVGRVALDVDTAIEWNSQGIPVVLMREQTSAADVQGMISSVGVVTAHGGMTSHAAVVARGMGLPCVSGCTDMSIEPGSSTVSTGSGVIEQGDWVTVDATHGTVYAGRIATVSVEQPPSLQTLLGWADDHRRMIVLANADTPADAARAIELGAQGIGLCRTEHMFFGAQRLTPLVGMLLAGDDDERATHLSELRVMQRHDFSEILDAMHGRPITIRLLDPPLHEFLPAPDSSELDRLAEALGRSVGELQIAIEHLHEQNPMMGTRGIRLAAIHPDIYRMQARAIAEAIIDTGVAPGHVSIMLPLVMNAAELRSGVKLVRRALATEMDSQAAHAVQIGTMIELPRACVAASSLARSAEFFSFGTNDLTQTTLGLSRDDTADLITRYVERGVLTGDPFTTLDEEGVGALLRIACDGVRGVDPMLEIGVCGEHAADPASINFFELLDLDYISCSPPRLQIARLAAAQATIRRRSKLQ